MILYLFDRRGQSFAATKTTFVNDTLRFDFDIVGAKYEGKMSADGNTITGPGPRDRNQSH